MSANRLRIGGITPLTSIDFPGRLAAVLYCQGCPWRCGYCHNPELLDATTPAAVPWPEVLAFLKSRQGLLDGVVFSGGEPTLQAALPAALAQVRALGFQTALHTGGMYPERLQALLPLLDWVGLDIKGPLHAYDAITRTPGSGAKAFDRCAACSPAAWPASAAPPGTRACSVWTTCLPWPTRWPMRAWRTGRCRNAARRARPPGP